MTSTPPRRWCKKWHPRIWHRRKGRKRSPYRLTPPAVILPSPRRLSPGSAMCCSETLPVTACRQPSAAIGSCLISYMFESLVNKALPLNDFLEAINTELYKRLPSHIFMAASLLHIDRHNNHIRVRASNCGMPDILHLRGSTTLFYGKSGHSPLGIQSEVDFTQNFYEFEAKPGDRIYLQTDGAVEAMTESGEPFGQERLELFLHSDAPLSSLQQTLENFTGSNGLHDDLSLMEIKI
ncbi:MAG: hypothetical protein DIZ77_09830 [endosymbiont of Seepiophila jonesi]|uniref:PPM-type phosphatase domain-containing protein n=1 Tax=endosymbiont of Lamellibrachia luymesi TaxID=2200907 RepID=A0A370DUX0_9GAMM|nr:MAG: hypothetical protein DIZ79_13085 [endosymbiont of Lamellibrachia luymesi]RDH91885.1 MAG: hypothetical protein DIZ77_09830 [endosymbiont of Seepiophila jonesi]